jgi:hypothetical protein
MMFACTVHDPLQESLQTVLQSVDPGCASHFCVHCASQLDEHCDEQPWPVQPDMHPAWQSEVQ